MAIGGGAYRERGAGWRCSFFGRGLSAIPQNITRAGRAKPGAQTEAQHSQGQHDDLARLSRTRSGQSRRRRVVCRAGLELLASAMPRPSGRVSTGQSAFQIRKAALPNVPTHTSPVACCINRVDHSVTITQSNSSPIACMQTGLCRMRTESLAVAFTAHRETDFGRQRRKAPNRLRAVLTCGRGRTPGI
jgi:hypothetical protein